MENYSIGQVAKLLNISISTLRYYDKEGLLDNVERTDGGIRIFHENDILKLNMLECLKSTGMPLKNIKIFFEWCKQGDSTLNDRYKMFLERKAEIEQQISDLQDTLDMINYKCEYYKIAMEAGTLNTPRLETLRLNASKKSPYIKKIVGA